MGDTGAGSWRMNSISSERHLYPVIFYNTWHGLDKHLQQVHHRLVCTLYIKAFKALNKLFPPQSLSTGSEIIWVNEYSVFPWNNMKKIVNEYSVFPWNITFLVDLLGEEK